MPKQGVNLNYSMEFVLSCNSCVRTSDGINSRTNSGHKSDLFELIQVVILKILSIRSSVSNCLVLVLVTIRSIICVPLIVNQEQVFLTWPSFILWSLAINSFVDHSWVVYSFKNFDHRFLRFPAFLVLFSTSCVSLYRSITAPHSPPSHEIQSQQFTHVPSNQLITLINSYC